MLGYRTIFHVKADPDDLLERSVRAFRHWLSTKPRRQYDGDAVEYGVPTRFAEDAMALLVREEATDGSLAIRATLTETNEVGVWTTKLTTFAPRGREPWLWIDVDGPPLRPDGSGRRQWTSTPQLARALLGEFGGFDGLMELHDRPERAFVDDVDAVIDVVCDPLRRGLAFVAGTAEGSPTDMWMAQVGRVLGDTVGLAGCYVLDAEATRAFESAVGSDHAVPAGAIRTFRPGVDPASTLDARRHRILGPGRMAQDQESGLRRLLGWVARETTIEEPVPHQLLRLNSRLEERTNSQLVAQLDASRAAPPAAPPEPGTAAPVDVVTAEKAHADERLLVAETELLLALAAALHESTGAEVPIDQVLAEAMRLVSLGAAYEAARPAQTVLADRLATLTTTISELDQELAETKRRVEDAQLDLADTNAELTTTTRSRDALRLELTRVGHGETAWADLSPTTGVEVAPESFAILLSRLSELDHIVFTGSGDRTSALDEYDPMGTWAAKAWSALLAANDYAVGKASGEVTGGMHEYLQSTPAGMHGFSVNRHARDESEPVKANSAFRGARVFPVPARVAPEGEIFMGAHFKLAQFGMISPRVHYLDATGIDGCIYVGHIGPHLPTHRTN